MLRDLERYPKLTEPRRDWLHKVAVRVGMEQPAYENLVSSGKAPRGREVELLVKDRPLRPPGRR